MYSKSYFTEFWIGPITPKKYILFSTLRAMEELEIYKRVVNQIKMLNANNWFK